MTATGDRKVTVAADMERPPYGWAAVASGLVLLLYILTLAPTAQFWDAAEYIAVAQVLGIPHPPGNPLFVVLANVWGNIPFHEHYAWRINLFSAACTAVASGFLFLVADRFLRPVVEVDWARRLTAFAGVLAGATSFTIWNQSVVNEKVYTLSLLSIALVLWLMLRWGDRAPGIGRDKLLLLIGYLLVLASTNHMMGVLAVSAVVVYVLLTDWREALRPWIVIFAVFGALAISTAWAWVVTGPVERQLLVIAVAAGAMLYAAFSDRSEFRRPMIYLALLAVVVGISLNYAFLPIRAAQFPPISEGEPVTWAALLDVLNREQYGKPPVTVRMAEFKWQLANYWQYVTWQFAFDHGEPVRRALAFLFTGIGILGAVTQWRTDRRGAAAMIALMFTVTILLVYYLNFRYGFSIRPGEVLDREVRERDYFFMASFHLWGVWVALGLGTLLAAARRGLMSLLSEPRLAWGAATPVLALSLIPLWGNHLTAPRSSETIARDFAVDLLQSVEPYAILITAGDNDMFPIWYAQEVEGVRQDVLAANLSLMNTDWHVKQLLRRETFPFDTVDAAAPYRAMRPELPEGPVLPFSINEVESLPLFFDIRERSIMRVGDLEAVLEPGRYDRATLLTLQFIRDNLGKRPIYFARTTGPIPDRLGLTPYLLGQGLARKVMPEPIEPSDSVVGFQGIGWFDLERTRQLLFEVYHPESAARERPRGWIDEPSENILSLYAIVAAIFAQGARAQLDTTDARTMEMILQAEDWAERTMNQTTLGRQ